MIMSEQGTILAPNKRDNHAPSIIRIAMGDEEDDVEKLCRELHAENGFLFGYSEEKSRTALRRGFEKKGAMTAVIGSKGRLEAAIHVSFEQFGWSDDWYMAEWFTYVRPEFRRSQHLKELLRWGKGMSERLGLILFIGVISNIKTEAKLRLYRREFGTPIGGFFCYRPKMLYSERTAGGSASTSH